MGLPLPSNMHILMVHTPWEEGATPLPGLGTKSFSLHSDAASLHVPAW